MIITKTKEELVKVVAKEAGITLAAAEAAVNTVKDAMVGTLKGFGRFQFSGVGIFSMVRRAARQGRNPQDGSTISIPEKWAVKFKEAADLKREINPN